MAAATNGIFPRRGVPANRAARGALDTANASCDELFYAAKCNPRIDVESLNTIISEIVAAVNCAGLQYDCNELDNLCNAIRKIAEDEASTEFAKICASAIKNTISSSDYIVSCTADGIRRINFSEILSLIPDPSNRGVVSFSYADGSFQLRLEDDTLFLASAPPNWELAASGTLQESDTTNGFPDVPGSASDPGQPGDTPNGVKLDGDAWINTRVPAQARTGVESHYRAFVDTGGSTTGASAGKPWAFETTVIPVTYWWGPHQIWIRVRPLNISGLASIGVFPLEWRLERYIQPD